MDNPPEIPRPTPRKAPPRPRFTTSSVFIILIAALLVALLLTRYNPAGPSQVAFGLFWQELTRRPTNIASVEVKGLKIYGEFVSPPEVPGGRTDKDGNPERYRKSFVTVASPAVLHDPKFDEQLRNAVGVNYRVAEAGDNSGWVIGTYVIVTLLVVGAFWLMLRRTRDQVLGGGVLGAFSKSPARRYQGGDKPVTFADVAGVDGVKNELEEVVQFLRNPAKFQRLGGRVPKGILLMGPPGTGKTLLGRAVAGEAGVPFFSISGSEFIQMFVGVGASRVRDMFATAKENAPSILFIDEIDAVGRHRGAGLGGGHDEREQTLNQILSEMDGFAQNESVIVMAATNRPDILDPALLRPGRFDRHITVDRPNLKGRLGIFKVHCRGVPLADDVDLERLAAGSVGLTGADIRNLVNEAAIWATRRDKDKVDMSDFEYARDKILMGTKREEVLTGKEKGMVAYHEAGHALVAWLTESSERVHKISIIPRGRTLGATQLLPEEDRVNVSESELHNRLAVWLAGRSAERLVFNESSAGAENDLKQATQVARRMVSHWGMSERLGPVAFRIGEEHPFLGKEMAEPREFSEHTARVIDEETVRILRQAADRADRILKENRPKLDVLAQALEREEVLEERQIEELIGPSACHTNGPRPPAPGKGDSHLPPQRPPNPEP
jgi:cell division protease FtsH